MDLVIFCDMLSAMGTLFRQLNLENCLALLLLDTVAPHNLYISAYGVDKKLPTIARVSANCTLWNR